MEDAYSEINENYGDNAVVNTAKMLMGMSSSIPKGLMNPKILLADTFWR